MTDHPHPFEPRPVPPRERLDDDRDPVAVGLFLGIIVVFVILAALPLILDAGTRFTGAPGAPAIEDDAR